MADSQLLKEVTVYGGLYRRLSEVLYYSSDRTVSQYKKMRMHSMCWMGLNFLKLGLANVPPVFECDEDENIRIITERMFKKIWKKLVREATESLDFGFKAFENRYKVGTLKYWDESENLETFDGILLKSPKGLDGETIEILTEKEDGTFRGFRQHHTIDVLAKERKALVFTHNLESGQYYGISALEPAFPHWYDANLNRQFHMRWLERKGTGLFKGIYPSGQTKVDNVMKENQDVMLDLLDSIMEGTAVALPSGRDEKGNIQWDISFISDEDKTDSFIETANQKDQAILRALIIPEKALTQGEVGARASVEKFQDALIMRKQEILDDIADTIDKYLLPNFIEVNFGPDIEVHVTAGKLDDDSKTVAAKLVEKLIDKNTVAVKQQWLIDKTGIPLEDKEELPEEEVPAKEDIPEEDKTPEDTAEEDLKKGEDGKEVKKKMSESMRWRDLTNREKSFGLAEMPGYLDKMSADFQEAMKAEMLRQIAGIKKDVDKNYSADAKFINIVSNIAIRKAPVRKIMKNYIEGVYNHVFNSVKLGVEKTAYFASADPVNSFIAFRIGQTADKFANDFETAIKFKVSSDVGSQLSKPEVLSGIDAISSKMLDTKLLDISETELGFALSKGSLDYYLWNQKAVKTGILNPGLEIVRYKYSAIMDNKVCPLCEKMDDTTVDAGSPILAKFQTPIHYLCRCLWLPITRDEVANPRILDTDLTMNDKGKLLTLDNFIAMIGGDMDYKKFSEHICCA